MTNAPTTLSDNFGELAREIESGEDDARLDKRLTKVARHSPAPDAEKRVTWRSAAAVSTLPWLALMAGLVALWRWEDVWASLPWGKLILISAFLYGAVTYAIHASDKRARAMAKKPE